MDMPIESSARVNRQPASRRRGPAVRSARRGRPGARDFARPPARTRAGATRSRRRRPGRRRLHGVVRWAWPRSSSTSASRATAGHRAERRGRCRPGGRDLLSSAAPAGATTRGRDAEGAGIHQRERLDWTPRRFVAFDLAAQSATFTLPTQQTPRSSPAPSGKAPEYRAVGHGARGAGSARSTAALRRARNLGQTRGHEPWTQGAASVQRTFGPDSAAT